MQSESAVLPRATDTAPETNGSASLLPGSGVTAASVAPVAGERAHLRLLPTEDVPATTASDVARALAPRSTVAPRASSDDIASPPLADSLDAAASTLWASPADVLGLLAAASEHRRIVDLIWNAAQIGALQLPPALLTAMERARASWPQALPA